MINVGKSTTGHGSRAGITSEQSDRVVDVFRSISARSATDYTLACHCVNGVCMLASEGGANARPLLRHIRRYRDEATVVEAAGLM